MISANKMRAACFAVTAAALAAMSGPAAAMSPLTPVEWSTLSDYCKAWILRSGYKQIVPPSNTLPLSWANSMPNIYGLADPHHFCMGLVYLERAKIGKARYQQAIGELTYSQSEMEPGEPGYPYATSYVATAYYRSGDRARASSLWQGCIQAQPQNRLCYLSMADALFSEKRFKEALELLLKYDEMKDGEYPDAEHFIARALYENKRYAEALTHAERASELGYPSSGLRDKLRAIAGGRSGAGAKP